MSVKVSNWAWHEARDRSGQKITGNPFILLLALADVADDSGYCKYASDGALSYDGLAEKTGVVKRTIIRLVAELLEQGLIDHRPGKKGRSNEFKVLAPWVAGFGDNLAPKAESDDEDSVTAATDSVTTGALFGDNASTHSSIDVINVTARTSSEAETVGQRFARPLCLVLFGELDANGVKHATEIPEKWLVDARLLVDRDRRDPHAAKALIEWACRDAFWRANILSMPTFRKQYDKLRLARERDGAAKKSIVEHGRDVDAILRDREQRHLKAVGS